MESRERATNFGRSLRESSGSTEYQANGHTNSLARAFLQPIAAPSILGLFGFAAATFMVSAHLVGWYGQTDTPVILAPFAATFGGIGQVIAAIWGYKARDGIATAMHGAWGLYWIAYGIVWILIGACVYPSLAQAGLEVGFGYWFAGLAAVTFSGALAAMRENLALSAVLHTLWIGAGLLAVGLMTGVAFWEIIGGYVLLLSALLAWYTATALMFQGVGTPILPVFETKKAKEKPDIDVGAGEPGVQHGQ
jgi:uncharacterized protein